MTTLTPNRSSVLWNEQKLLFYETEREKAIFLPNDSNVESCTSVCRSAGLEDESSFVLVCISRKRMTLGV